MLDLRSHLSTMASIFATAAAAAAQAPVADLQQVMERLAAATTALERAAEQRDRDAYRPHLQQLRAALAELPSCTGDLPKEVVTRARADAEAALDDLQSPVLDGARSDAWDLARLRRACTGCHLQTRRDNDERGSYPNRHNLVSGSLQLLERDGSVREDASDLVVFLESARQPCEPDPRMPVISQRERRFDPGVLVVTRGTTVGFPNDDVVFHNVFSRSRSNWFDLGTYGKGTEKRHTFDKPGLVKVHCNIHPDMASHILVLDTPLHTVTASSGFWAIGDVPDGDYTLRVWHVLADEQRHPIRVADGQTLVLPLAVQETRHRVQHTDKHGRPYKQKY